jgi:hypothetical protein
MLWIGGWQAQLLLWRNRCPLGRASNARAAGCALGKQSGGELRATASRRVARRHLPGTAGNRRP